MANNINESQLANASKTELIGYVLDTMNHRCCISNGGCGGY